MYPQRAVIRPVLEHAARVSAHPQKTKSNLRGNAKELQASGVTMGWLLRLVTGGAIGKGAPGSSRVLND